MIALVAITFMSCGSDDNGDSTEASIVGSFNLVEINSSLNDDYNNDGEIDTNLLVEVPCIESMVTFEADGSYSATSTTLLIEDDGSGTTTATCEGPYSASGTYSIDGDAITINEQTTTDPDGAAFTIDSGTFVLTNATLTVTVESPFGPFVFVYARL